MGLISRTKESARDVAKSISEGKAEPRHLGKHTIGTMEQEVFSLQNTKEEFRDSKWHKRHHNLMDDCVQKILSGDNNFKSAYFRLLFDLAPRVS